MFNCNTRTYKRISNKVSQVVDTHIQEHSKKPDIVRDRIVELIGDLPRIELLQDKLQKVGIVGEMKFKTKEKEIYTNDKIIKFIYRNWGIWKALRNLNVPYELVGFSEIDKFAIKSYCAIHNVDENKNLGDVKNISTKNLKEIDFMTWGFPCQDVSIAGHLKGIEKGKTRSGLYFEGYRILKDVKPKISIIENVKI